MPAGAKMTVPERMVKTSFLSSTLGSISVRQDRLFRARGKLSVRSKKPPRSSPAGVIGGFGFSRLDVHQSEIHILSAGGLMAMNRDEVFPRLKRGFSLGV